MAHFYYQIRREEKSFYPNTRVRNNADENLVAVEPLFKSTLRTLLSHDRPCVGDCAGSGPVEHLHRVHWHTGKFERDRGG